MKKKRLLIPWSVASCMSRNVAESKENVATMVRTPSLKSLSRLTNVLPVNFNLAHQNQDGPSKLYQPNASVDAKSIEAISSKPVSLIT
jgi:hypothetical protein